MYSVAFIGTGPDPDNPVWGESAAMAYRHAAGYDQLDECELVACADIVREHGLAFAERFGIPNDRVYEDYEAMLEAVEPDFVSISTPVPTHADLVLGCIDSGVVGAIHCEKPMATTWEDCREMASTADEHDVQLTFNHQRRFGEAQRTAKERLDAGEIGEFERVEMGGKNIYDFGTHLIDLCNYYADEADIEWVIGQIDYREEDIRYGAHNENQSLVQWRYEDGLFGLASTGELSMVRCHNRLIGSAGVIEIGVDDGPALRMRGHGNDWSEIDVNDSGSLPRAIAHIVEAYDQGVEPVISAKHALRATEVVFATWESARRRGRIDLPLEIDDNPLEAMVDEGIFTPVPAPEE